MGSLDANRLDEVFEGLRENAHKLNSWECDRLEEWEALWERGVELYEKQLDCLERMWLKV
jgi:hypothetical protein